jgi:transcriptional regulator GlxA family with amidase domain
MLPCVSRVSASDLPLRLSPVCLVHVIEGELALRDESGPHRLRCGELLALRAPAPVELASARSGSEALFFRATHEWVGRVLALSGADAPAPSAEPLVREAAGSEIARRAGRLLLAAYLEGEAGPAAAPGIAGVARLIEIVGIACGARGSLVAPRLAGARSRSRRAALVRVLEELESAPLEGFSLRALAERLGVSERHASRLLRDELGTSLPEYLGALRIERAKKRLATTEEPVIDVALGTGWQSVSHFNAVFRRRVGVTPSGFRALARGGEDLPATA